MHSASGPRPALPSVLVIEDDPVIAEAIAEIVGEAGYKPVSVSALAPARAALASERPGVVILDLTLQSEFGADLLEELAGAADAPPVVIVSAFGLAKMVGQRYSVPVVMKPFGIDQLLSAVEKAFSTNTRPSRVGT